MPEDTQNDEFTQQLGSMDGSQLQELLNEMGSRMGLRFAMGDPDSGPSPTQYRGAGFGGTWGGSGKEAWRNTAGNFSGVGQWKHHKRSSKAKKQKREFDDARDAEAVRQKQVLGERMKMVEGQIRTVGMRGKVNQQFRDMDLEGLFDRVTKQGLDSSLIGITQQHEDLSRNTGFQAAAQGLGGGSVDAERIADVQSSQDQAAAQAASQAQMQNRQLRTNADQTRQSLLNSVSGSNPGEEARLNGEMANIQNNANSFVNQAGLTGFGMQQNQQNMAGQSQALGGLLSNYANMYTMNNMPAQNQQRR